MILKSSPLHASKYKHSLCKFLHKLSIDVWTLHILNWWQRNICYTWFPGKQHSAESPLMLLHAKLPQNRLQRALVSLHLWSEGKVLWWQLIMSWLASIRPRLNLLLLSPWGTVHRECEWEEKKLLPLA